MRESGVTDSEGEAWRELGVRPHRAWKHRQAAPHSRIPLTQELRGRRLLPFVTKKPRTSLGYLLL